jgi:capsule polysaccharide export protein KpsC/LpsZ
MPRGGEFSNQIRVIKMLSDALPDNGIIIVKEHPFTFNPIARINKNFRPVTYYSWLSRIPKVVLVPLNTSSSYLQSVSDYICTITGNAGLEAMIKGKKVIVFGAASYLNGPNVNKINSIDDLKRLFSKEVVENANDAKERAIKYIESISQFCHHSNEDFSHYLDKDLRDRHFIRTLLSAIKFEIKNN